MVAVALMGCGVALLGSVTALLASWLVAQVNAAQAEGREVKSKVEKEAERLPR